MPTTLSIADLDAELAERLPSLAQVEAWLDAPPLPTDQAHALRRLAQSRPIAAVPRAVQPATPAQRSSLPSRSARLITVASGKGGVGKTTISVNLAIALAERGLRVCLVDADFGTANADLLCGLSPVARLEHIFAADTPLWNDASPRKLREIAVPAPGGFLLVPGAAGVARMADLTPSQRAMLVGALTDLDDLADIVIADLGAGAGPDVTAFLPAADLALVVTTPEPTAIADAYALVKCALARHADDELRSVDRLALVVNQVSDESEAGRVATRLDAVCRRFLGVSCALLASVAHDPRVGEAVRARSPLMIRSPHTPSARDVRTLAGRVASRVCVHSRLAPDTMPARPAQAAPSSIKRLVRSLLGGSRTAGCAVR